MLFLCYIFLNFSVKFIHLNSKNLQISDYQLIKYPYCFNIELKFNSSQFNIQVFIIDS
jgi:hypothetical protein